MNSLLETAEQAYYPAFVHMQHNPSGYLDFYSLVYVALGALCRYLNVNIYLFLLVVVVWKVIQHRFVFPEMFRKIGNGYDKYDNLGHAVADVAYAAGGYFAVDYYLKQNRF
jgi:hypothetical protein